MKMDLIYSTKPTLHPFLLSPFSSPLCFSPHRLFPFPRSSSSALLVLLLAAAEVRLGADAAKDQADAEVLAGGEVVAEPDDGEDHGEHLPRHGHGD